MKFIARFLALSLLAPILSVSFAVAPASAAPGKLTENFASSTLNNPNNWVAASTGGGLPHPCLTARNKSESAITLAQGTNIGGCDDNPEADGAGALILTPIGGNQTATMLYNSPLSNAGGLDISFYQSQYGGAGADGISFFVKDGNKQDLTTGLPGGGLGYKGIPGALFGVGFDSFGNWLNRSGTSDQACLNPVVMPKALAIRGPDTSPTKDGSSGFCVLPGGLAGTAGSIGPDYFGKKTDTRLSAARPVRILVDPSTDTNPKIRVYMWKSGDLAQDVNTAPISLTVDQPAEYKAATSIKFGFSSATGGSDDNHAIWGLQIAPKVTTNSPTVYIVPGNVTVRAGENPVYTNKFYSDAAKTVEIPASNLTYSTPVCTSSYSTTTNYTTFPATLPISCSGANVAMYNVVATDTAVLTITRGTPSIAPATSTLAAATGIAITPTAGYTSRNFANPSAVRYSTAPALPTGLSIDATTGVITGSPNTPANSPVTVIGTADAESATAQLTLNITGANQYSYDITYDANGGTGTMAKQTGSGASVKLTANAFTRTGFAFNGWKDDASRSYTDTQTVILTANSTLILRAQWLESKIPAIAPTTTTISGLVNNPITTTAGFTAVNFTGTVTYTIAPALPAGLVFNASTGAISGTATAAKASSAYTVTATDGKSSATAAVDIAISTALSFPYAISYGANGGTGTMSGQTGTGASVKLSPNAFTRTGFTFSGWKDDAGVAYTEGQVLTLTTSTSLALNAQWTAPAAEILVDKIISISPKSGYPNDEITITGEFYRVITSISVDGLLLPANSWKQDKTTVKFVAPGHAAGKVNIKLGNGITPELPTQQFEYLALKGLGKTIGIDNITCLGTFEKACSLKPGAAQPVSFKLNSNALSAKSITILKSWQLQNAKSVIVYGYASKQGSKALNDKLTKKRAAEVGAWVKKNWPNLSIKTIGLGTKVNRLCKAFDNKCAMIKIVTLKK
jgi:uncharacterized repeat protein (TIGR02543 family)